MNYYPDCDTDYPDGHNEADRPTPEPFANAAAARWEDFESEYRPLSAGGWFLDEDGEEI